MVPLRLCHLSPEFPLSGQELLLMTTRTTLDWKAHGDLDPQSGQKTLTEDVLDILWPLTLNRCTCPEDKPDCLHDGQKDSTRSASCPEGQTLLVHEDSLRDRTSPHRDTQMDQRHFPAIVVNKPNFPRDLHLWELYSPSFQTYESSFFFFLRRCSQAVISSD